MCKNILLIDWSKRSMGSSNNFFFSLSSPITIKKYIKLIYAQIPNLIYNIKNDSINIILMNDASYTLNLNNGSYSISELINHISSLITALNIPNCNILYNKNTFKITLSINNINNFQNIIFSKNISSVLGFNEILYNFNGGSNILSSEKAIKLNYNSLVCISLDKLSGNHIISNNNLNFDFVIPINSDWGSYIILDYKNQIENINNVEIYNELNFSNLQLQIKNENNEYIENQNSDLILIFEYL